jgi:hypothetical protein
MVRRSLARFLAIVAASMLITALIGALRGGTQADWLTLAVVALLVALGLWLAPRLRRARSRGRSP